MPSPSAKSDLKRGSPPGIAFLSKVDDFVGPLGHPSIMRPQRAFTLASAYVGGGRIQTRGKLTVEEGTSLAS